VNKVQRSVPTIIFLTIGSLVGILRHFQHDLIIIVKRLASASENIMYISLALGNAINIFVIIPLATFVLPCLHCEFLLLNDN